MQHQTLISCTCILAVISLHIGAIQPFRILGGEFTSYRQVGDKIMAEYERLNPDGSISRAVAHGDTKSGLQLENFEIDPQGNILNLEPREWRGRIQDRGVKGKEYQAEFIPNKELPRQEVPQGPDPQKETSSRFWDILSGIFY